MYYRIEIDGHSICYSFREEHTVDYFSVKLDVVNDPYDDIIVIPKDAVDQYIRQFESSRGYAECMNALYMASNVLLDAGYCAFHAVALMVNGKGYLIAAESGVGKSTQYMNLKKLYPDVVEIINGDKPFLQFKDDQKVILHTSPWRGKERFGSDLRCELDSIILLRQADENCLTKVDPKNAVVRCLRQFLYYPDSMEVIRKVCNLERRLLNQIPVFMFSNTGDLSSSELLYKKLLAEGAASYV